MSSVNTSQKKVDSFFSLASWLAGHQALVLSVLIICSVALRAVYFVELNGGPCIWMHRWDQSDMNFFHLWAREIISGDWLVDKVFYPDHYFYREVAKKYRDLHPEALPGLEREAREQGISLDQAVWGRWFGGKRFHQDPLYPYFIALNYLVFGEDPRWIFLWQMLAGVGTNVLVYLLARRYFGEVAAMVSGILVVFYGPLLFYELVLLRESFLVGAGLLLVYLTPMKTSATKSLQWVLYGLAVGFASLLKNIFLPYWVAVMGVYLWQVRQTPKVWLKPAAASALGVLLGLSPLIARNLAVGTSPLGLASTGPATFIVVNDRDFDAGFIGEGGPINYQLLPRILGETNGALLPTVIKTLQTHDGPWSYLRVLWGKFTLLWYWYEIPDNNNFYYYQLHANVLRYLATFQLLGPLALIGLLIGLRDWRGRWPLYLYVGMLLALMLAFCPMSRWRLPLVGTLFPFAGLTLVTLAHHVASGKWKNFLSMVIVLAGLFWWTSRPLPEGKSPIRRVDYSIPFDIFYLPEAQKAAQAGDCEGRLEILEDALRLEPPRAKEMSLAHPPRNFEELGLAWIACRLHRHYARALRACGQDDEAISHERRGEELFQLLPPEGKKEVD